MTRARKDEHIVTVDAEGRLVRVRRSSRRGRRMSTRRVRMKKRPRNKKKRQSKPW